MRAREMLLRVVLLLRGSIPTWMLTAEEVPLKAKGLTLGAVAGVSGPLVGTRRLVRKDDTEGKKDEF